MAALQDIYNLTIDLLDKRDGTGTLDERRLGQIRAKFPQIAMLVMLEVAELCNKPIEDPYIMDFSYDVNLPDFPALSVMPYGIAAEIARQGGDMEAYSAHAQTYTTMKKKIRLPMRETADVELLLAGLSGRA